MTEAEFAEEVAGRTVVIDFWASWCAPCTSFAPVFNKVSGDYSDVVFGKVDVDANPGLASAFAVTSIPTTVVLKNDQILARSSGALTEAGLRDLVDKALAGPKRLTFRF